MIQFVTLQPYTNPRSRCQVQLGNLEDAKKAAGTQQMWRLVSDSHSGLCRMRMTLAFSMNLTFAGQDNDLLFN